MGTLKLGHADTRLLGTVGVLDPLQTRPSSHGLADRI